MKKQLKITSLFVLIIVLMVSCMPVNEALKNRPYGRITKVRNTKPIRNSSSSSSTKPSSSNRDSSSLSSKSNSNIAIYEESKAYLQKRNTKLTDYCTLWIGTPHVLGGCSRQGVDCSGFVYNVYKDVYEVILPRRSSDMENEVKILNTIGKLNEGDLVFFGKNSVNHVGIFLNGDNFIHASTSKGVIVSSLEEKYWKQNFRSCGHHPQVNN